MYNLTNRDIKILVRESFRKTLLEALDKLNVREGGVTIQDVENALTLYHRPKDANIKQAGSDMTVIQSIFKNGFSREFTCSNGGNLYGAGVYTVYKLESSQSEAVGYGDAIIKVKLLGGLKDFLILDAGIAKSEYGSNWKPGDQIRYLFPDKAEEIFRRVPEFKMNVEGDKNHPLCFDKDGNEIQSKETEIRTNRSAHTLKQICNVVNKNWGGKCRGAIYNGNHDGDCCIIFDFQSVIPVAISYDNGKTFENKLTQQLLDKVTSSVDTEFQLGEKFHTVADHCINGYTQVWDNKGNTNYVPADSNDTISDKWFDDGMSWSHDATGTPFVEVIYKGRNYFIVYEDDTYQVYSDDWEPLCDLNDL